MTWDAILTVLATTGVLGATGWGIKELIAHLTGRNAQKMAEARTALSVMGMVGLWQDAYYRAREWCWTQHGYSRDYPQPPVELGRAADRLVDHTEKEAADDDRD